MKLPFDDSPCLGPVERLALDAALADKANELDGIQRALNAHERDAADRLGHAGALRLGVLSRIDRRSDVGEQVDVSAGSVGIVATDSVGCLGAAPPEPGAGSDRSSSDLTMVVRRPRRTVSGSCSEYTPNSSGWLEGVQPALSWFS